MKTWLRILSMNTNNQRNHAYLVVVYLHFDQNDLWYQKWAPHNQNVVNDTNNITNYFIQ